MARKVAPLSDAQCSAAKPLGKEYKLFDGNGLYLLVETVEKPAASLFTD